MISTCKKAAEQGNFEGQFHLGDCYAKGKGVVKDKEQARFWYGKGIYNGFILSDAAYRIVIGKEK